MKPKYNIYEKILKYHSNWLKLSMVRCREATDTTVMVVLPGKAIQGVIVVMVEKAMEDGKSLHTETKF